MSTPIKSPLANGLGQGGVSGASELTARLQAQARGVGVQVASQSFASLMSQHGQAASQPKMAEKTPEKTPEKAPGRQAASNDPAAKAQATARAQEQVLARARQQALANQKPAAQPTQPSPAQPESAQASAASTQPDPGGKADPKGTADPSRRAETGKESGKSSAAVSTTDDHTPTVVDASSEALIPTADPAGMMAWLAGLRPDVKPDALTGAETLAESAQDSASLADQELVQLAATESELLAQQASPDAPGDGAGMALDPAQWQHTTSLAGLQVDALLGRAGSPDQGLETRGEGAGALSALMAGVNVRPGSLPTPGAVRHESATLPTPFGHADFGQALADKVNLWVNTARTDGAMTAELHLNPAEMGPIQVKIALEGQSAKVDFAAAAVETRKAIEASMSALSSALSDVGLNLTGGGVSSQTSQQSFGQQSAPSDGVRGSSTGSSASSDAGTEGDAAFMREVNPPRAGRLGGLDLYA